MVSREQFLLVNLALAFYNVGTIWAHEVDIFRSWKWIDPQSFRRIQSVHWRKLPFWVFIPVGLSFIGSVWLLWYHPARNPSWEIGLAVGLQSLSHLLTAILWGPWQAKLSRDAAGGESIFLSKILRTHWIRTFLITVYGLMLLVLAWQSIGGDKKI